MSKLQKNQSGINLKSQQNTTSINSKLILPRGILSDPYGTSGPITITKNKVLKLNKKN